MFRKVGSVASLGSARVERGLGDTARFIPERRVSASAYLEDGARKISVGEILARSADKYKVSADPADYFFEAIRANTTNPPNENNDGFHQSELLRFDLRVGMPVYQTYSGKPHHVDHKTADPTRAKGIIIDTTYNDRSPALESCPRCALKTAARENRDATGLHCNRCGHLVRDEFVEILVGVDTKKDPTFADGVRTGHLNTGSMGCSCLNTRCNTCGHVAYNEREFCAHVRAGSKGGLWLRDGSDWRRVQVPEARRLFERVGYRWDPVDFCYATAPGFELRKGFEYCENVLFDEYSRVPQPADPKARQREVLRAASLDPASTTQETPMPKTAKYTVIRVDGDPDDLWAGPTLKSAASRAAVDGTNRVEVIEVTAANENAALNIAAKRIEADPKALRPLTAAEKAALGHEVDGDIELEVKGIPPGEAVSLKQSPALEARDPNTPQEPAAPDAAPPAPVRSIEDVGDQLLPAAPEKQLTPADMGMRPPGAAKPKTATATFAASYADFSVKPTKVGNLQVLDGSGRPVLLIPARAAQKTGAAGMEQLTAKVERSVREAGLVATARAFRGAFSRMSDVVDGGLANMQGYLDHKLYAGTGDNIDEATDMQDKPRGAKPPASTRDHAEGASDMQPARATPPAGTLEGGAADHSRDESAPASALEGTQSDMQEKREPKKVTDSVSEGGARDFKAALDKYQERERRAWATREAKLKAAHEDALKREAEAVREATLAGFQRALRLAAARQMSGLEASPMRQTAEQLLATSRPIGADAHGQPTAAYEGMVPELARYIAAELMLYGHGEHLENLMSRAASLLDMGDRYLLDAERDAQRFAAALPPVTAASVQPLDPVEVQAAVVRQAAMQGNLPVAGSPPAEHGGHDKRAAIRGAVNGTQTSLRVQDLTRAVN